MKTFFIVCPTYRDQKNNVNLRLLGVVTLIEQMKKQTANCIIKISIVDSSSDIHPFFANWKNDESSDILYFHIPNRNNVAKNILKQFQYAASFIPSNSDIVTEKWSKIVEQAKAWGKFIPWDKNYPVSSTFEEQIARDRPSIGMKRNFAIASLFEKFGKADYICYADDDDFRSEEYMQNIIDGIADNDFARMFKFYSLVLQKEIWGIYDISFEKDINGNWLPLEQDMNLEMKNALNHRKTAYKKYTVKERFTPLLSAAFPHLSCEGALHVFKFELWKNSINDFGGVPIVSLGEDILFYKNCMSKMGEKFKSDQIKIEKPSLLKIDDGHNASVLEWTYDLSESDIPQWCKYYVALIDKVSRSKNNTELNEYFAKISKAFLTSGEIKWY